MSMAETKPLENKVRPAPRDPGEPVDGTPAMPGPPQPVMQGGAAPEPNPVPGTAGTAPAGPAAAEARPAVMHPEAARNPIKLKQSWVLLSIALLLAVLIILFAVQPRHKQSLKKLPAKPQNSEENQDLSNYSAFIAQNKALQEKKATEEILTDEPFAGQAPLVAKADVPIIAPEIDPQLAALADALRIRVRVMQGSQSLVRGNTTLRTIKGEFRGFRVNSLEKLENGMVVSDEIRVETPKKGVIKTVGHVLEAVQKTDFPGFISEMRNAGMEFSPAPVPAGENIFRGQIRVLASWRKTVADELLISGKNVGPITLGMPVDQMNNQLLAAYIILKRKVLVNDKYYDVYKVLDRTNEPLLYVYEKDRRVWGISIISAAFKTEKGIGIGNSLDQMRIHYPVVKLSYSEKKTPFVQVEAVAGIFIIQGDGEKKIISILVGDSPEFE
jgi:uncharacterized integral membrane protein